MNDINYGKLSSINNNPKNNFINNFKTASIPIKENLSLTLSSKSKKYQKSKSMKEFNENDISLTEKNLNKTHTKNTEQNIEEIKSNTDRISLIKHNLNNDKVNIKKEELNNNNKDIEKINDYVDIKTKIINNKSIININIKPLKPFKRKKYKFRIYKPLNPLLVPHGDMVFNKEQTTRENFYQNLANNMHKMPKKKLDEIKIKRKERINREKKNIENSSKLLQKIGGQNSIIKSGELILNEILHNISNAPIKINTHKAKNIIEESGLIIAYKYLIQNLCKNGMPEGNIYDYCSEFIKNFEKIWQKMKFKMLNDKIEEHYRAKKEEMIRNNENNEKNIYYKVLKQREKMKFLKKLDKSRSSLRIIKRYNIPDSEMSKNSENLFNNNISSNNINLPLLNNSGEYNNINIKFN